jgi:cell division protein FtsB
MPLRQPIGREGILVMADQYPKSYDELVAANAKLVADNAALRADIARLQSSIASLQSTVVARDSEIARLRRPKVPPRVLDKTAKDKFARPAILR